MNRRSLHYADFDAAVRDAEQLLAVGYDRVGSWSLGQIATHLALVMEMSLDGFPKMMPWIVRLAARWFALGGILRRKVFRRKVQAPAYMDPGAAGDDRVAVERFRTVVERFKAHTGPLKPSPIFGQLTNEQWREVHLWHCEHHFSFLLPRQEAPR